MGTIMGTRYHPSTLIQLPAKGNKWYVVVTKPIELQTTANIRVRRSTGTTDEKLAKSKQHAITQAIYKEFDAALTPPKQTLAELCEKYWGPTRYGMTAQEQIDDSEGGNLWAALDLWELSGHDEELAISLFDYLEPHEAELFRARLTPKGNPYPIGSNQHEQWDKLYFSEQQSFAKTQNPLLIRELTEKYISERDWNRQKTRDAAQRYLNQFNELAAPKHLIDLKRHHAYRFAEELQKQGLAQKTIKSAVSAVSAFLTDCEKKGFIDANPFSNLKLSNYGKATVKYKPFNEEELIALFAQKMDQEDRLCLSILATTGMRLDEVALLQKEQIKRHKQGFQYIDITDGLVKNEGSKRFIPIHPSLEIKISGKGRLFSYPIGADGKAETAASKKLMKLVRNVTPDTRLVVHSLRGTFKDMLRNVGVTKEMNDFITGHGTGDSAGKYGEGPSIQARYDAISRLNFDFIASQ